MVEFFEEGGDEMVAEFGAFCRDYLADLPKFQLFAQTALSMGKSGLVQKAFAEIDYRDDLGSTVTGPFVDAFAEVLSRYDALTYFVGHDVFFECIADESVAVSARQVLCREQIAIYLGSKQRLQNAFAEALMDFEHNLSTPHALLGKTAFIEDATEDSLFEAALHEFTVAAMELVRVLDEFMVELSSNYSILFPSDLSA